MDVTVSPMVATTSFVVTPTTVLKDQPVMLLLVYDAQVADYPTTPQMDAIAPTMVSVSKLLARTVRSHLMNKQLCAQWAMIVRSITIARL